MNLFNWLVKSKENLSDDTKSALHDYFVIASKLSILVALILILAGSFTLLKWNYFDVNIEALASYMGTLFATVVAFAGSIVAINLAMQGLNVTKEQNRFSEEQTKIALEQTRIAKEQNSLTITQKPEYLKGLDAAIAYARFKGILLLLPFELRSLQKRKSLDTKSFASGADEDSSLSGLSKHLNELLNTTFITVFAKIASKSSINNGGADLEYLFLNRFSVLQSRKNLLRGVMLALTMQEEVDEIIKDFHDYPFNNMHIQNHYHKLEHFTNFEAYSSQFDALTIEEKNKFKLNEIEFWFIKHVFPYSNLADKASYSDFNHIHTEASNSLYSFLNKIGIFGSETLSYKEIKPFTSDSKEVTVVASLEDSALFKIINHNRNLNQSQKKKFFNLTNQQPTDDSFKEEAVIQITITDAWDIFLAKLIYSLEIIKSERKAEIIVIFDQVGLYKDSFDINKAKYLLLSQHLIIWKFFRSLLDLYRTSEAQINQVLWKPAYTPKDEENAEFRNSDEHQNRMRIFAENIPDIKNILLGDPNNNSYKENFNEIISSASSKIFGSEKLNQLDEKAFDKNWADLFSHKLSRIYTAETLNLNFDENEIQLIEHLAQRPLFDRPIYGLKYSIDGFFSDIPNKTPKNVEWMAYVTYDEGLSGKLSWPDNIFIEWLMFEQNKKVYWIN